MKSKVVAALLAIFLGGLGAHKFYLGKIGQGFLYLIFCWTWIPGVVALIEGIIYLCCSDEEFQVKYCGGRTVYGSSPDQTQFYSAKSEKMEEEQPTFCVNCGRKLDKGSQFCPNCGSKLIAEQSESNIQTIVCPNCGKSVLSEFSSCPYCNTRLK